MIRRRKVKYGYHYDVILRSNNDSCYVQSFDNPADAKWCNEWLRLSLEWDKQILARREPAPDPVPEMSGAQKRKLNVSIS